MFLHVVWYLYVAALLLTVVVLPAKGVVSHRLRARREREAARFAGIVSSKQIVAKDQTVAARRE